MTKEPLRKNKPFNVRLQDSILGILEIFSFVGVLFSFLFGIYAFLFDMFTTLTKFILLFIGMLFALIFLSLYDLVVIKSYKRGLRK